MLRRPPLSEIDRNYRKLLEIWEKENMSTMFDYLKHYSSLDVVPMLKAIVAYRTFFIEQNIDVFKDCISVPGVARKMLFKSGLGSGASFSLLCQNDKDLYDKMTGSLMGAPSIVTTRYHEVDKTFIRGDKSKPCKNIIGYDFNSLYLYAIGQNMPTGPYIRCLEGENFKPRKEVRRHVAMYHWLDWLNHSQNKNIISQTQNE